MLLVGSVGDSSLELTDGWYSILSRFSYGSALHSLVARGLIAQVTQAFSFLDYHRVLIIFKVINGLVGLKFIKLGNILKELPPVPAIF